MFRTVQPAEGPPSDAAPAAPQPVDPGSWEYFYRMLVVFVRTHGHAQVPPNSRTDSLGYWLPRQCEAVRKGEVTPERQARLEDLGVHFELPESPAAKRENRWNEKFALLQQYVQHHGHCCIPRRPENRVLMVWLMNQRLVWKQGHLAHHRVRRLEALGVPMDPGAAQWDAMYEALVQFHRQHGHCRVPRDWPHHEQLGTWVNLQRHLHHINKLTPERARRLEAISFEWQPPHARWEEHYLRLVEFKKQHGHCDVPCGSAFSQWVAKQRIYFKQGRLPAELVRRLDALGFHWIKLRRHLRPEHDALWKEQFERLVAFQKEHGHCNVPQNHREKRNLGVWLSIQRQDYHAGRMRPARMQALEQIGIVWDCFEQAFEDRLAALTLYRQQHGHCNVPSTADDKTLVGYVNNLRRNKRVGKLTADQIRRLEAIDFVWEMHNGHWENHFRELVAFHRRHGHCLVPDSCPEYPSLSRWVQQLRHDREQNQLDAETLRRLDALGFVWNSPAENDRRAA